MIYDDKKFIGEIIRKARKKAKLNQAELSEKLGMSEKNLGNIENGRQYPQVNNFLRIIETLELNLEDFGVRRKSREALSDIKNQLIARILSGSDNTLELYNKAIKLVDEAVLSK